MVQGKYEEKIRVGILASSGIFWIGICIWRIARVFVQQDSRLVGIFLCYLLDFLFLDFNRNYILLLEFQKDLLYKKNYDKGDLCKLVEVELLKFLNGRIQD